MTHEEVMNGILDAQGIKDDHCVCFVRILENIEDHTDSKITRRYLDVNGKEVDTEAQEWLNKLRDKDVPAQLGKANIIKYNLKEWSDNGIDVDVEEHKKYLEEFLKTFKNKVIELVERAVKKNADNISNDKTSEELLQHMLFCQIKCSSFHGREDILSKIGDYVNKQMAGNVSMASPLVVQGESGSGKTSIMAKSAMLASTQWVKNPNAVVVLRFLGTTPASTGVRQLLRSICQQILAAYGADSTEVPNDYFQVVSWFSKILGYAKKEQPLVIFLDSLDQLSAAEGAHRMAWLPRILPPYCAVVVSTLPKTHGILDALKLTLTSKTEYVEVTPLSMDDSKKIITSWLATSNRKINDDQNSLVTNAIQKCRLPLFLKLVFDQACKWHSYDLESTIKIEPSVKGMINVIFQQLEDYHGETLVKHSLGYITISQVSVTHTL